MNAVRIHAYGGPDVLVYEDVPLPQPAAGEVRIKIRVAGLNPGDAKAREGIFKARFDYPLPTILGCEVAGDIDALGPGVTEFAVGDPVYAMTELVRNGAYAEYVVLPVGIVAPKSASLDYQQAASVPVAALTAYQVLHDVAALRAGQRVLIHAGAGSVGSFAIQFAKQIGAEVITTASAKNADYVRELGADQVIDYQTQAFENLVSNVDLVFDAVGGEVQTRSWRVLRPGGQLASIVQPPSLEAATQAGATGTMTSGRSSRERLEQFSNLFDRGQLRTLVGQTFPLSETRQAHEQLQNPKAVRGKVVLLVA